jgi:hypothetical protein
MNAHQFKRNLWFLLLLAIIYLGALLCSLF